MARDESISSCCILWTYPAGLRHLRCLSVDLLMARAKTIKIPANLGHC